MRNKKSQLDFLIIAIVFVLILTITSPNIILTPLLAKLALYTTILAVALFFLIRRLTINPYKPSRKSFLKKNKLPQ
jgi:hypothetical protein